MKPVISFHGNGESVVLSNYAARFTLMQGATGLGWSPRDLTMADLAGGGGVLRHVRASVPKVMIPLLLGGDYVERREDRRLLERLFDGRVEIRVTHPDGLVRSRFGWFESGLQGDYGPGEDSPDGQKLALTFECPDPLWYGAVREIAVRVAAARKAFLTGAAPRVGRKNMHPNPRGVYGIEGFQSAGAAFGFQYADVSTSVKNEESWVTATARKAGQQGVLLSVLERLTGPVTVSFDVLPGDGVEHLYFHIGSVRHEFALEPGKRVRLHGFDVPTSPRDDFLVIFSGPDEADLPVGATLGITNVLVEQTDTLGAFFDGDSGKTGNSIHLWEGTPGRSASVQDARGTAAAYPFFPVLLSDSTVQGAYVLTVQGDHPAWPTWIVDGPGEDLLIQNDETGDRIFIDGTFPETVTITTQPQIQDVTSHSEGRGSLWSRVSEDSVLFPLKPGINRIRVSMVNAKPESRVVMRYREAFKAGM